MYIHINPNLLIVIQTTPPTPSTKSVSVLLSGLKPLGNVDTGFVFLFLVKQASHVLLYSPFLLIAKHFNCISDLHLAHFLSSIISDAVVDTLSSSVISGTDDNGFVFSILTQASFTCFIIFAFSVKSKIF